MGGTTHGQVMSTFISSDHHFGHRNISRLAGRPFPDTDDGVIEMNEALIEAWNSVVGSDDTVMVLGDFAMGRVDHSLPVLDRLNGTKHLIYGNHDKCSPDYYRTPKPEKVAEWTERYLEAGFSTVSPSGSLMSDDIAAVTPNREGVLLHHYPYSGDTQGNDRHADSRPIDDGAWLVHGHMHEAWRQRGRQINVGVDAWAGRPVALEQIVEMIAAGENDLDPIRWVL